MAELLEKTNSSYFQVFKDLFRDVVAGQYTNQDALIPLCEIVRVCLLLVTKLSFLTALTEAQDVNLYLKPLQHHFEDFMQIDFDLSEKSIAPMFHCLCLVWSNSQYYNTPARVVVVLQEMCNMMIECVSAARTIELLTVRALIQIHNSLSSAGNQLLGAA